MDKEVFLVRVHTELPIELFQGEAQEPLRAIWLAYKQLYAQLDRENRGNPKNLELMEDFNREHREQSHRFLREQPFYREIPAPIIHDNVIPASTEEFTMDVELWLLGGFESAGLRQAAECCLKQFTEMEAYAHAHEYRIVAKYIRPTLYALHYAEATGYSLDPDSPDGWQLDAEMLPDPEEGDE